MSVIYMPFGLEDLEAVFAVTDLLSNKEELVNEFMPEVKKYLVKDSFFTGHSKRLYEEAFTDLIISLIKRQVIKHFPILTPEEILLLCEPDFLKMIAPEYFNPDTYRAKEGLINEQ